MCVRSIVLQHQCYTCSTIENGGARRNFVRGARPKKPPDKEKKGPPHGEKGSHKQKKGPS